MEKNKKYQNDVDVMNAFVEDEIYFKYKVEAEEIATCYENFLCENDKEF